MNDMSPTIIPKSDQKNADDLLAGPITIKITDVTIRPGTEQPVSVFFEGDDGKPWKPCKSMARVLVAAWGPDSKKYIGRSLTLYCDKKVKWAGLEVGGIRISHMSDIDESMTMALTVTRANKKPFTVKPLARTEPAPPAAESLAGPPSSAAQGGADLMTADQCIDISDKLIGVMRGKERLLNAISKKLSREFKAFEQIPAEQYQGMLAWIEKAKTA